MLALRLLEGELSGSHIALCIVELCHVGDYGDLRNGIVLLHLVASLDIKLRDDTLDLRLDVHLVTRLHLATGHACLHDVTLFGCKHFIDLHLGLGLLIEVIEGVEDKQSNHAPDCNVDVLLHIV